MRWGKQLVWVACLLLSGCGTGTYVHSEFGKQVDVMLIQHNSPGRHQNKSISVEQAMQLVVFDMTKGLSREHAMKVLMADGASCEEAICRWEKFERLSFWEKKYGKLPPNPIERWRNIYSAELLSQQIMNVTDIQTSVKYMEPLE